MGSFNVACGISNLSINEGDRAGLILIAPTVKYASQSGFESATMRIYATADYQPYLPPVYGTYDDYGRLTDITESTTTKLLEALFNKPAEAVVNAIGGDRGFYDSSQGACALYLPEELSKLVHTFRIPDDELLAGLGFTLVLTPPEGYREAYAFNGYLLCKHSAADHFPGLPEGMEVFSWAVVEEKTGRVVEPKLQALNGLYTVLNNFAVLTGQLPGYPPEDWTRARLLSSLSGMFFLEAVYTDVRDFILRDSWSKKDFKHAVDDFNKSFEHYDSDQGFWRIMMPTTGVARTSGMRSLAELSLLSVYQNAPEEYLETALMVWVLTSTNHLLQPSFNGEQFGNDPASSRLTTATRKFLTARKKDRAAYDD